MPSAAAATEVRNTSSVRIAILKPWPPSPMRCVSGMRHSWNSRRASGCGAITSMRSAMSNPGVPSSTMKAEMPRAPSASPLRAKTT
jgi:hypothetical protein